MGADATLIHGALEDHKLRDLASGGRIEFEFAPAGWLTKRGEVRQQDYRSYRYTPPERSCEPCSGDGRVFDRSERGRKCAMCDGSGNSARRRVVPSVTTILDEIMAKPGIPPWSEARGIEGAVQMVRDGRLDVHDPELDPVAAVREAGMGADAARKDAAKRGINVHALSEEYFRTGALPNPIDHPVEHHGYIRAWTNWIVARNPEPVSIEELVYSARYGYAGRLDLCARMAGSFGGRSLFTVDKKSQERGQIFASAHLQVNLYEQARVECGADPADELVVVSFAENGRWREMTVDRNPALVGLAMAFYNAVKPIVSGCESLNRIEREARKAVTA